jgi:hypothetical protein
MDNMDIISAEVELEEKGTAGDNFPATSSIQATSTPMKDRMGDKCEILVTTHICDEPGCEYTSKYRYNVTRHKRLHDISKRVICTQCDHTFTDPYEMQAHLEMVHEACHLAADQACMITREPLMSIVILITALLATSISVTSNSISCI